MSTTLKNTMPSSFESTYVPLELLSYLKSGQVIPFQIFKEIIIPDFLQHLFKAKDNNFFPSIEEDTKQKGIVDNENDNNNREIVVEGKEKNIARLREKFERIKNDIVLIEKVCWKLESWETEVNRSIKKLILQCLDDAYKERTETLKGAVKAHFLERKLSKIEKLVSMLKNEIYSPLKFSSNNLDSDSFKLTHDRIDFNFLNETIYSENRTVYCPILEAVNVSKEIAVRSTFEEIKAVYEGLGFIERVCLLCFSVFPENAVIKKKVLVHWWVGEGFIDGEDEAGFLEEFEAKGLIEPVFKQRPTAVGYRMQPSVRFAVIMLAERAEFIEFDTNKNPTANFSGSRRAFLVESDEGSSVGELTWGIQSKQENVRTVFNVSEHRLEFESGWFSKMKYVRVLQLGRWQSSAKHFIEVEDSDFLKGLRKMKHLRYLSLRGVSKITELPSSISKLESLRILNLNGCHDLEKLPDEIGSLKKLTHLDMYECSLISHMPKGLAYLSELQVFKGFVIGGKPRHEGQYCQLEDLTKLENLKKLSVHVDKKIRKVGRELSSFAKFEKLKSLSISWSRIYNSSIPLPQNGIQRVLTKTKTATLEYLGLKGQAPEAATLPASLEKQGQAPEAATLPASLEKQDQAPEAATLPASLEKQDQAPEAATLPASLEKLDLHYFPGSEISTWFSLEELNMLKKLYIRGGKLSNLNDQKPCWSAVKFLRLKFLSELKMDWSEMKELFPEMVYMEKCKCPNLTFFPCDESGIWKKF